MNIGLVSLQYGKTATGGGGVHVNRIADEYLKSGNKVTIFTMHTGITEENACFNREEGLVYSVEDASGIKVVRFLIDSGLETPYDAGGKEEEYSRIKRFCDTAALKLKSIEKEFDVVHLHGHHLVPGYLAKSLKDTEFKVVSTIHFLESTLRGKEGVDHINKMPAELYNDLKKWETMTAYADEIVTISSGQRMDFLNLIEKAGSEFNMNNIEKKLHLISSGVEDESIISSEEIIEKWKDRGRLLKILSYSRLDPSKGLHYSIAALPKLIKLTDREVKLTVAGIPAMGYEDVLKDEKAKLTSSDNCELVFFNAIAGKSERNAFMDKFDVYMFPTLSEPFGITIIEAVARGMFIITTDSAGPLYILGEGEIEDYGWGFISDYGINVKLTNDYKSNLVNNLTSAWEWFIGNQDKAIEKILNFRKLILEKYTWTAVVNQYLEMYKR